MAQSQIDILMRTRADKSGTNTLKGELGEVKKGLLGGIESMTGFSVASLGTAAVIAGVSKVMADSVKDTMVYAAQVRDLALASGTSAEQSSRLIQTADDLGVSYESLTAAAKKLATEGIALTIDELAKAADEYLAIEDAGKRAEYVVDKFGKAAGPEMAKMLAQGGDAIRKMADEQEGALILTDEQVAQARELEKANDALGDTWKALTTELGMGLIPVLIDVVTWLNNVATGGKKLQAEVKKITIGAAEGTRSYEDYRSAVIKQIEAQGLLIGKYGEIRNKGGQLVENVWMLTEAQWKAVDASKALTGVTEDETQRTAILAGAKRDARDAAKELAAAQAEQKTKTDILNGSMKELTKEMLFNKAAANLDADAALALGRSLGLVNEKTYGALTALEDLRKQKEAGVITTEQYVQAVKDLAGWIDGLHSKTITIDVIQKHKLLGDPPPPGWTPTPRNYDPRNDPTLPDGGSFYSSPSSTNQASVINNSPVTIHVNGSGDPERVAREVAQVLRNRR